MSDGKLSVFDMNRISENIENIGETLQTMSANSDNSKSVRKRLVMRLRTEIALLQEIVEELETAP